MDERDQPTAADDALRLFDALHDGDFQTVERLLAKGVDLQARIDESSLLCAALHSGHVKAVTLLLKAGADPNEPCYDWDRSSALYWAVEANSEELVRILIDSGARVSHERPTYGSTSLHRAAEEGNVALIALPLDAGGGEVLQAFDCLDRTPLGCAVHEGHIDAARTLIAAGSDVNAANEERAGDNTLRRAIENADVHMVELLLEHGANPLQPGWVSLTPLDIARSLTSGKRVSAERRGIFNLLESASKANARSRSKRANPRSRRR